MRHAHVCRNAQTLLRKIAPSQEVVTHGSVDRQLLIYVGIAQQFENRLAAFAVGGAAMHDSRNKAYCFAQVLPRDCVSRLTLGLVRNGRNAKDVILARHGSYR
jgi:hypothetical protein